MEITGEVLCAVQLLPCWTWAAAPGKAAAPSRKDARASETQSVGLALILGQSLLHWTTQEVSKQRLWLTSSLFMDPFRTLNTPKVVYRNHLFNGQSHVQIVFAACLIKYVMRITRVLDMCMVPYRAFLQALVLVLVQQTLFYSAVALCQMLC